MRVESISDPGESAVGLEIVEAVSPEHWAAAVDLLRRYRSYAEDELHIPPFPHDQFEAYLRRMPVEFSPPNGRFFLARKLGAYVGCIGFHQLEAGIAEIKRMFVLEKARGLGVGGKLLSVAIEAIEKDRFVRVRLDTHPKMQTALQLYRRSGFSEIPRYNDHPLPDIIFMERVLQRVGN